MFNSSYAGLTINSMPMKPINTADHLLIPTFSDKKNIEPKLDKNIIISAHGNSIRSLCKYLFELDNESITKLEIPTGNPLLITFDNNKVKDAKYLDSSRAKNLIKF